MTPAKMTFEDHVLPQPIALMADEETECRRCGAVLGSIGYVARQGFVGPNWPTGVQVYKVDSRSLLNRAAQKTSMNGIRFQKGIFKFSEAVILSVTDASHAAELHVSHIGKESGHKSHTRRMILLADRMPSQSQPVRVHILNGASHTIKRVCRSTLQAEVLSSMDGSESAHYIRHVLYSLTNPRDQAGRLGDWRINSCNGLTSRPLDHRLPLLCGVSFWNRNRSGF